ncbi:MAG: hypothetical protein KKF89_06340 [Nanoarchaeota archaeon]|nr:hypothetical protein [Nanoarchaeota archaeon]MBU1855317.1 hypothetical protein [Nanoarchaeota archaeon]
MNELKCSVHGLYQETTCSWCGESICKQCIEASDGRKYCTKCYQKLSKNSAARFLDRSWGEKPGEKVVNVDPMLTDDELKKKKQMLEIRARAKKIMSEKY